MIETHEIEACARAAHEANRAYCIAMGDTTQVPWEEVPGWLRDSVVMGVRGVIAGNGPEQSHEAWLAHRAATGWKFGPVKNVERKEHPCFVPYAKLPAAQQSKDHIFVGVVKAMLLGLGL